MTRGKGRARMAALAGLLLMPFAGATFADDQVKTTSGIVEGVRAASPAVRAFRGIPFAAPPIGELRWKRSEEHTSELQSRGHLVCRLLLEKKKNNQLTKHTPQYSMKK